MNFHIYPWPHEIQQWNTKMDLSDLTAYLSPRIEIAPYCFVLQKRMLFHHSVASFWAECQRFVTAVSHPCPSCLVVTVLSCVRRGCSQLQSSLFSASPMSMHRIKKEPRPFKQDGWKRLLVKVEIVNTKLFPDKFKHFLCLPTFELFRNKLFLPQKRNFLWVSANSLCKTQRGRCWTEILWLQIN